jgi:hypothetical protein
LVSFLSPSFHLDSFSPKVIDIVRDIFEVASAMPSTFGRSDALFDVLHPVSTTRHDTHDTHDARHTTHGTTRHARLIMSDTR